MQRRPSAVVSPPLALPLSQPPLPRHRSSLLPQDPSPHTPPNCTSPLPFLASATNRKSSDSWNSSNYDGADDLELEWSPEQTRLLSRTLDALPAHLLTPFNGPVPPSNLLDKIARGVAQAKGPVAWPHSLRATRAKIVELARLRAKETASDGASDTIAEEDSNDPDVLQQGTNTGHKRPLYRQSSMDFVQVDKHASVENDNISRLSRRLQRADRLVFNPSHHAHSTSLHPPLSPALGVHGRGIFLSSTPSSTTLNSTNSDSRDAHLRRSMSDMSNSSDSFMLPTLDLCPQRVKRAESFAGSMLYGPGHSLKRAPSFGATSKRSSGAMSVNGRDSDVTSDEEEKLRSMKAKKRRVKPISPSPAPLSSPILPPDKAKSHRKSTQPPSTKSTKASKDDPDRRSVKSKANLQRNPSILGDELPHVQSVPSTPATRSSKRKSNSTPKTNITPAARTSSMSVFDLPSTPTNTQDSQAKSLKRSKGTRLPQRAVARKISFGSLDAPVPEENPSVGGRSGLGLGLGSAFQLH